MIKEQIEWLIEHKYMKRDEDNINMFIYMAWKDLKKRKSQQTYAKHRSLGLDSGWTDLCCAALPKKSISLSAAAKKKFDKVWANIYQTLAAPSAQCDILC